MRGRLVSERRDRDAQPQITNPPGADRSVRLSGSNGITVPERGRTRAIAGERVGAFEDVVYSCAEMLASAGPIAVLAYLNSRTRFRFTGIYRADPPNLLNLHLYDRENPKLNLSGGECGLDESCCALFWKDAAPFETLNARRDRRAMTQVARERVLSYCGVPIRSPKGFVQGALCHYDVRPRIVPRSETGVLEHVASLLSSHV